MNTNSREGAPLGDGLYLRGRTYYAHFRWPRPSGRSGRARLRIGTVDEIGEDEARLAAIDARQSAQRGVDPRERPKPKRVARVAAKPDEEVAYGGGLYMRSGGQTATWFLHYRDPSGVRRRHRIGATDANTEDEARAAADDVRKMIEAGIDPRGWRVAPPAPRPKRHARQTDAPRRAVGDVPLPAPKRMKQHHVAGVAAAMKRGDEIRLGDGLALRSQGGEPFFCARYSLRVGGKTLRRRHRIGAFSAMSVDAAREEAIRIKLEARQEGTATR